MYLTAFRRSTLWGCLQLLRPANIVTAWADVFAGVAIAGYTMATNAQLLSITPYSQTILPVMYLLLATTGLYGGGIVLNDYFDAELDAVERPERPIPSGQVSLAVAGALGSSLLGLGILAAAQVSWVSATVAIAVASLAVLYDAWAKSSGFLGPIVMGSCRAGNLLLGITILWPLSMPSVIVVPWVYILAITLVSQAEVDGAQATAQQRWNGILAFAMMGLVLVSAVALGFWQHQAIAILPFAALLGLRILPSFGQVVAEPTSVHARTAVRAGILSLIILDATLAASFAGLTAGLLVLLLLPLSMGFAKVFAVT